MTADKLRKLGLFDEADALDEAERNDDVMRERRRIMASHTRKNPGEEFDPYDKEDQ